MACVACNYDELATVRSSYTLVLPFGAQSLNAVGVNSKNNRGYRGARNKWKRLLKPYEALPKADSYRRIFFTRFWGKGKRGFDYGNLVGGFKPLLDEIVRASLLVDDSPKHCAEYYRQYKSPDGTDCVVIVIEELEDAQE